MTVAITPNDLLHFHGHAPMPIKLIIKYAVSTIPVFSGNFSNNVTIAVSHIVVSRPMNCLRLICFILLICISVVVQRWSTLLKNRPMYMSIPYRLEVYTCHNISKCIFRRISCRATTLRTLNYGPFSMSGLTTNRSISEIPYNT